MRTSVKNSWQNPVLPVTSRSGCTSRPGVSTGQMKTLMPLCFGTSQFVRATSSP